jgi:hypothetical protein
MKTLRILTSLVIGLLIASCAQAATQIITPVPTLVTLPTASTRLETMVLPSPTNVPSATLTLAPSLTPTLELTATLTLLPSQTFSPTPAAVFTKAQVTSLTTPNNEVKVALRVPGLKSPLNIILDSRKFNCQMDAIAPEVLFCTGTSRPHVAEQIPLVFVDPQSGAEVYSGSTFIINQAVPTATREGYGSCPNRGKNVACETECRIYSGDPCLVVSCFDDCGLYYSLDNCPGNVKNDGVCSEEQYKIMKDKYGIP